MDFVCSSCGIHASSTSGTPGPCLSCGGATWRRLEVEEPDALLGVVEPPEWIYVGADDPESPQFQNGWQNARRLADGTIELQSNRS